MRRPHLISTTIAALAVAALSFLPTAPSTADPATGDACDPVKDSYQVDSSGHGMACEPYADGNHHWQDAGAESTRIVQPGDPCPGPNADVATGPQGQKMVCVGDPSNATWKAV
ncbi:hypothetical protein [Nocardia aurantia]|uniref:Secreted protein n=1 Tax=Nocardia aurantia TaxID=2585199 RepID=A0A7K0DSS0_9NOCA|nr:hypothetical protein [Nocardia aurantia]MQY28412.1 hypothetical protein [Nocardia aurantia]